MTQRQGHRTPRNIAPKDRIEQISDRENLALALETGIVGDASATGTRSGDDARRRGWFWHWNHVVTQYAPLLGLKGVGLLNSYTVWTDRREESPHRGYAFPSQQSEADFYGEDRSELITINKILVALDLIEIRKEMVYRVDPRGRRWKVPHNFYRVKDQGEGVSLTTADVLRVIELADRDRAVYRYVRKLFSPKFSPIDPDNVWHRILEDLRPTETWQRLADRTERDETRASARSKAGHAARRTNDRSDVFSLPVGGDSTTLEATAIDSGNDTATVDGDSAGDVSETTVAKTNKGSTTSGDQSNKGLAENSASSVDSGNNGRATSVAPTNRTYNQEQTTTTTSENRIEIEQPLGNFVDAAVVDNRFITPVGGTGPGAPPDARRDEDSAIRCFEEANNRPSTMAERRLLRGLAANFDRVAQEIGTTGWFWVADAIDEAVAAGSRFVAPKRIREILNRWQNEGRDDAFAGNERRLDLSAQASPRGVTQKRNSDRTPISTPTSRDTAPRESFTLRECGLTSRQIWNATLAELRTSSEFGRAGAETWLRDTHLIGRGAGGSLVVGVGNALALRRLEGRYLTSIRQALSRVTGVELPVEIVDYREWRGDATDDLTGTDTA